MGLILAVEENPTPTKISLMIKSCNLNIHYKRQLSGSTSSSFATNDGFTMEESSTTSLAEETSEKKNSEDNEVEEADESSLSQQRAISTSSSVLSVPAIEVSSAPSM